MKEDARSFAIKAHAGQKYGEKPYEVHLSHVHRVLEKEGYGADPILSDASWLHDVVEDTQVSLAEIARLFGADVADTVGRVTDEPGNSRKERKQKTYPKIRGHRSATIIKLCDRIANVEASQIVPHKFEMYKTEYPDFRSQLYVAGIADSLWLKLDLLLAFKAE